MPSSTTGANSGLVAMIIEHSISSNDSWIKLKFNKKFNYLTFYYHRTTFEHIWNSESCHFKFNVGTLNYTLTKRNRCFHKVYLVMPQPIHVPRYIPTSTICSQVWARKDVDRFVRKDNEFVRTQEVVDDCLLKNT